ncbi:hypothetical protein [Rubritalea marina]|uniref:hypothetical protein n=1 Tax=Rubritalea marina TaxID=361055 RepID=UPI00035E0340|nr:hypothetical protein [Rubritalea marina]
MLKQYVLENPEQLAQITFFLLTLGLFVFNMVYAIKMDKDKAQEIAKNAIELDD